MSVRRMIDIAQRRSLSSWFGRWSPETSRQGRMYRCGRHHWSSRSNFASGTFPLRMGGRRRSTACSTPCNRRTCTCFPVDTSTQRRTRESGLLGRSKGRQRLTHGTPRKRAAHGNCRARTPAAPRRAATRNRRQPWRSALAARRETHHWSHRRCRSFTRGETQVGVSLFRSLPPSPSPTPPAFRLCQPQFDRWLCETAAAVRGEPA